MAVNKLVSRNLIINKKILFPEGCIHEDELWSFMLACEAEAFTVVKKTTYNYYIREGSITESSKQKTFDASLKIYQMIVEYTKNRFNCFNAQLDRKSVV